MNTLDWKLIALVSLSLVAAVASLVWYWAPLFKMLYHF
jgi:hypothetical protein